MSDVPRNLSPDLPKVEIWPAEARDSYYVRPPGVKRGIPAASFQTAQEIAQGHVAPPFATIFVDPASLTKDDYPIKRPRKGENTL